MAPQLWLVRHAPTDWSESGRHTSRTDVALSDAGRAAAGALAPMLAGHSFALVLASPRRRALDTARLAGFPDAGVDPDLAEWDYGDFEGLTTEQIRARGPQWARWTIWSATPPGGETAAAVGERARRVLARADAASGDVLLFGHGHALRVLTAVALGFDPSAGARFALDAASLSVVGEEHGERALRAWNLRRE